MEKIDLKDRKILYQFDLDSRQSFRSIGRKVGLTIEVVVTASDNENEEFAGYIKMVNIDNTSDYCLIHVSLTTPKYKHLDFQLLSFLKDYLPFFPFLKNLF